jgi:hypothetical protein
MLNLVYIHVVVDLCICMHHMLHTHKLRIDLDTCGSFASIRIVLEYTTLLWIRSVRAHKFHLRFQ